jgi:pyruvate dehydrogenase E1 component alpha subunit
MIDKAAAYGMKGKKVDGMKVIEVFEATSEAIKAARAGEGPQFLEMITYRYEGHSMGDPLRYRTKDEVEKWREDDAIGILERHLLAEKLVTKDDLEAIDRQVEQEIEDAVQFAEESPLPEPEELFNNIYVEA